MLIKVSHYKMQTKVVIIIAARANGNLDKGEEATPESASLQSSFSITTGSLVNSRRSLQPMMLYLLSTTMCCTLGRLALSHMELLVKSSG